MAQTAKGNFEVYDFSNYKLHVYYTNDALGDTSYIIEGKDALVTMEQPLFKDKWLNSTLTYPNWESLWKNASRTIMWEEPETTMW